MKILLFLSLLPIALAGRAQVDEPTLDEWRIERREWTWEAGADASISVSNPWGNIAVRAHERQEVYLLANSQRHMDDPRALDLRVTSEPGAFSVVVGFGEKDMDVEPDAWSKRRTDITVFVPKSAETRFSTDKGVLEVRGTRGSTEVMSSSGDLRLRVHGTVTAETDHGDVLAQFLQTGWDHPVEITTLTGSIRVEMPQGGRADVTIETRGEITSDYSMEVERVDGSQLKRAQVAAGDGGTAMSLNSNRGAIQIVESLVPEEADAAEEADGRRR